MCADLTIGQQAQQLMADIAVAKTELELFLQTGQLPRYIEETWTTGRRLFFRTDGTQDPSGTFGASDSTQYVANNAEILIRGRIAWLEGQLQALRPQVNALFRSLDPRKILGGTTSISAATAAGWTILNTPIGVLAGSIGLSSTVLLGAGAAVLGGTVGGLTGYGINKIHEAVKGRSIGELWYDTNALGARSFAQWTTEHDLTDVSGWF